MSCSCCTPQNVNDLENIFDAGRAAREARKYLKKGLDKRARKLIAPLVTRDGAPVSVLDIGCGVGAVHQELLRCGVAREAVGVDAASAVVAAAEANARQLDLSERVRYWHGDFAQCADEFQPAEVVIMDRVICCYPHLDQLLGAAADRTQRFLALSFPLDAWWLRAAFWTIDQIITLFGSQYHPYVHRHADVLAIARSAGLEPVHSDRSLIWQILVFARNGTGDG